MDVPYLFLGLAGLTLAIVALWLWAEDSPERRDARRRNGGR